jgi:hypothetical protein
VGAAGGARRWLRCSRAEGGDVPQVAGVLLERDVDHLGAGEAGGMLVGAARRGACWDLDGGGGLGCGPARLLHQVRARTAEAELAGRPPQRAPTFWML